MYQYNHWKDAWWLHNITLKYAKHACFWGKTYEKQMAKEIYILFPLWYTACQNKDAAPGVYLNSQRRVACAVMHVCRGQLERDDSLSTCLPLLFCFLATSLRQHSGEISSMLDSSSSFTNSKAFLQTCLKNDIIYITDCFTYFCKCENHYINQKSHALYFTFLTS